MKHLLITGIPGTGKTCIGKYLECRHDYKHEDIEAWSERDTKFGVNSNVDLIDKVIEGVINPNKKLVATFGFRPLNNVDLAIVDRLLKRWNFKMFWFDGNIGAALREYTQRELKQYNESLITGIKFYERIALFFFQLQTLSSSNILSRFNPIIINPFGQDEKFRRPEEIAQEIKYLL